MKIRHECVDDAECKTVFNKKPRRRGAGPYGSIGVHAGFERTHDGCSDRDDAPAASPSARDRIDRLNRNIEVLLVHLMLRQPFDAYGREGTQADVEDERSNLDAALANRRE